jgi:hypothetical protein
VHGLRRMYHRLKYHFGHTLLLGDVGQGEARFGPFGDGVILSARWVHNLHRMYHGHGNHFGHTR